MLNAHRHSTAHDRGAVLTKAAIRAAERLDISGRLLAEVLGVSEGLCCTNLVSVGRPLSPDSVFLMIVFLVLSVL